MALIEAADIAAYGYSIEPAKLDAMLADAQALAVTVAPCLGDESALDDQQKAAAKAVLRSVILRWNDSGSGAYSQQQAGPWSVQYTQTSRAGALWPTDITQLQAICNGGGDGERRAFTVDLALGNYRALDAREVFTRDLDSPWQYTP